MEQAALIGRSAELQTALDLVAAETATLVITGEAGVGKSRLVDELVARTGAPHVRVGCFQLAGESIAFTVLDRLMERLAPAPRDQSHSGASGRVRTFERWLDGLVSVGGAQQGLLVVEDVHWADESTLAFLAFVTHVAPPGRLCTVLTLRDDEALPDQVRRGINDLLHHPRARTLDLQRLPPEDALALVAALGGDTREEQDIVARSGGNPYLLAELALNTGQLPRRVRDMLLLRARDVGEGARQLLALAAVAGPDIDDEQLEKASGWGAGRYVDVMRTLIERGLLTAGPQGYSFRHSLLREALLAELLPAERRAAHRALAEAMEATGPSPSTSAAIALHWHAAGDRVRARESSLLAAADAFAANAFAEAWGHYRRALEVGAAENASLAATASESARWATDLVEAVRLAELAVKLSDAPEDRARNLERLGRCLWEAGRSAESTRCLQLALELTEKGGPRALKASVLSGLARHEVVSCRYQQAAEQAQRALQLARQAGAREVEADAHITYGVAVALQGDLSGVMAIREALGLAQDLDQRESICRAYSNLVFACDFLGLAEEATTAAVQGLDFLRRCGLQLGVGGMFVTNAVAVLIDRGRLSEAETVLDDVIASGSPGHLSSVLWLDRARLALLRADWDTCRAAIGRLAHLKDVEDIWLQSEVALVRATLLQATGRYGEALGILKSTVSQVPTQETGLLARLCRRGLEIQADLVESDPEAGTASTEAELEQGLTTIQPDMPSTAAERAVGLAERARADARDDPAMWEDAAAQWRNVDRPVEAAYCLFRQAGALARLRRKAAAEPVALEAFRVATETGAVALSTRIATLQCRAHLRAGPAPIVKTLGFTPPEPLTRREVEVAHLLADGSTNRQIAETLFISERTAEVHVSRVLRKLAVTNRSQVAALFAKGRRQPA